MIAAGSVARCGAAAASGPHTVVVMALPAAVMLTRSYPDVARVKVAPPGLAPQAAVTTA